MSDNRNVSVILYRIMAAVFILICHIGTAIDNGIIAQFFVVGVQFFLFISGYLYGNKDIKNSGLWLRKRYLRLLIPVILYVLICLIIALIINTEFSWFSLPLYLIHMQGYYHLLEFLPVIKLIEGTQHLWFITIIFVCYIITLIIKKINLKLSSSKICIIAIIVILLSFVAAHFGFRIDYILTFFIGYFIKKMNIKSSLKSISISFIIMIIIVSIRLLLKNYCDNNGDIAIYTQVVVPLSCIIISIFTFFAIDFFVLKTSGKSFFAKIYYSKSLSFISNFTFYIYISHYIFIDGKLSVFNYDLNIFIKIVIFIMFSIFLGLILFFFDYLIGKITLLLSNKNKQSV